MGNYLVYNSISFIGSLARETFGFEIVDFGGTVPIKTTFYPSRVFEPSTLTVSDPYTIGTNVFYSATLGFSIIRNTWILGEGACHGPIWYSAMVLEPEFWSDGKVESMDWVPNFDAGSLEDNTITVTVSPSQGRFGSISPITDAELVFSYVFKIEILAGTDMLTGKSGTLIWKWNESQWF